MKRKRVNLTVYDPQIDDLEELGLRLGLDFTNTIRYCIARTIEAEKSTAPPPPVTHPLRRRP